MKNVEVEVKLLGVDKDELFSKLKKLGAEIRPADQEDFVVILGDYRYLRLRTTLGRHILTYKRRISDEGYSRYLELETEVSDAEVMKNIMVELFKGKPHLHIVKKRWIFEVDGVKGEYVEVNERLRYVELEGSEEDIERTVVLLGLEGAERSTKPLDELLSEVGIRPEPL